MSTFHVLYVNQRIIKVTLNLEVFSYKIFNFDGVLLDHLSYVTISQHFRINQNVHIRQKNAIMSQYNALC